jgi:hypothetical protein
MLISTLAFTNWLDKQHITEDVSVYDVLAQMDLLERFSFCIAMCNAFTMLISLKYEGGYTNDEDQPTRDPIHHAEWLANLNRGLGILQLVLCITCWLMHMLNRFPLIAVHHFQKFVTREREPLHEFEFTAMMMRIVPGVFGTLLAILIPALLVFFRYDHSTWLLYIWLAVFVPVMLQRIKAYCHSPQTLGALVYNMMYDLLGNGTTIFNTMLICGSCLGLFYKEYFYSFHLFKAVPLSPAMSNAMKAVTGPGLTLGLTMLLSVIVIYTFTIIGFFTFPAIGGTEENGSQYCR